MDGIGGIGGAGGHPPGGPPQTPGGPGRSRSASPASDSDASRSSARQAAVFSEASSRGGASGGTASRSAPRHHEYRDGNAIRFQYTTFPAAPPADPDQAGAAELRLPAGQLDRLKTARAGLLHLDGKAADAETRCDVARMDRQQALSGAFAHLPAGREHSEAAAETHMRELSGHRARFTPQALRLVAQYGPALRDRSPEGISDFLRLATDQLASLTPTHRAFIAQMQAVVTSEREFEEARDDLRDVTSRSRALESDIRRAVEEYTYGLFTYEPQGIALLSEGRGDLARGLFHVEEHGSGDRLIPATLAPLPGE